MGLNAKAFRWIQNTLYDQNRSLPFSRICLLGNLYFAWGTNALVKHTGTKVVHKYLETIGADVVSVDKNGKDGALRLDLQDPLPLDPFDIIINGGTTEHVEDHMACFKNLHEICKSGGLMFHIVALEGHWPGHCLHRYTEQFFRGLARAYGYSVVDMRISTYRGPKKHHIFACLKKD